LSGTGATFTLNFSVSSGFTITNAGSGYVEQPTVTFSGGGGSGAAAYATVGSGTVIRSLGSTLSFYTPNGEAFRVTDNGAAVNGYWQALGGVNNATFRGVASTQVNIQSTSAVPIVFATASGTEQMRVSHTASAVNYVQVTGAATGNGPQISAQGSDATVNLALASKGSGSSVLFQFNGLNAFQVTGTGTVVNRLRATAAIAGASPVFDVVGTDTDIDLTLTPKGAGVVKFGTYTVSALLAVAGYITIKDSGGTTRRLLVG
jgi:hypothetical protein